MEEIKVLELFGGIGACTKALKKACIPFKVVDYVEIDKYAVKSYNAINGTFYSPQDIKEWDKDLEIDLIMHGSPCQDFSLEGLNKGGDKGSNTRSSLMYETIRIVEKLKPKYVIWENVKNLLSGKHIHNFENYIEEMRRLGYKSQYKIMNSKDYNIPQNRVRVFTVSIREDVEKVFTFPDAEPLSYKLRDFLDKEVDKKYTMSEKAIATICATGTKGYYYKPEIDLEIARPLTATMHKCHRASTDNYISNYFLKYGVKVEIEDGKPYIPVITNTKKGYDRATVGDAINFEQPNSKTRRGRVGKQIAQTLTTQPTQAVVTENLEIRRLTPKEAFRLMGFSDEDFNRASTVNSDTQLYKQAGNSIVVNILENILTNLLRG